jgi:glycine betaine/proline transport system permease protein
MFEFPENIEVPLGEWIDSAIQFVLEQWGPFFDLLGDGLLQVMLVIERFFLWLPWFVIVIAAGVAAGWILRKWYTGVFMSAFLFLIGTFGYWDLAMMTLAIVAAAVVISLVVGIPVGIVMAWFDWVEKVVRPILDAMQTMPSFVYLIPALMLFGLGKVPAVFATIIYSMPPVIRLTNVGIRHVPRSVVEAAEAFGADRLQILFNVQLPLARPSIMVGINQTTMMALSMVVIASMIGARGLGLEVLLSINRIEIGRGFEAGLSIVILAVVIDRITHGIAARQQAAIHQ